MSALAPYLQLIRFDKPAGTLLLLWPAWWGAISATTGQPDVFVLLLLAAGAFVMRSAGCIINDLTDRDLDRHVARTASRPLAANHLSVKQAIALLMALLILAFIICLLLKPALLLLSLPALVLIILYPRMKRITWWPQVFLGFTFNLGVFFGWFAVTESISLTPFLLYAAAVLWTIGYDTIYAHQDIEDDLVVGIRSTAIRFGRYNRVAVALCYTLTATLWLVAGLWQSAPTALFILFWSLACAILALQIAQFKAKDAIIAGNLFNMNMLSGALYCIAWLLFAG